MGPSSSQSSRELYQFLFALVQILISSSAENPGSSPYGHVNCIKPWDEPVQIWGKGFFCCFEQLGYGSWVCLCVCVSVCVDVCVAVYVFVGVSTAQTDKPILMKLSTNHFLLICSILFSPILKIQIWWRHGGHYCCFRFRHSHGRNFALIFFKF